jgi:hypothetical protein
MALRAVAWGWAAAAVIAWLMLLAAGLDPEALCPDAPLVERSSLSADLTMWPPGGIECLYVAPDGTSDRTTRFPWELWGSTALFVAGVACAAVAPSAARSRPLLALAAVLLAAAGAAVWLL